MNKKVLFLLLLLTNFSCGTSDVLTFEKIDHETIEWKINPEDSLYQIHENFIVHNYRANKESEKVIDEFVCHYIDTLTREYSAIVVTFYKESRITNMKNLKEWPDDIVRSMDRDYLWKYGFSSKNELRTANSRR